MRYILSPQGQALAEAYDFQVLTDNMLEINSASLDSVVLSGGYSSQNFITDTNYYRH